MLDPQKICLGCMADRGPVAKCPRCGWTVGAGPTSPVYLPAGTILNGKYLIGRVLGHGGFGVTYLAVDLNLAVKLAIKEYLPRDLATRSEGHSQVTVYQEASEQHFRFGLSKFIDEARSLALFEENSGIVSVRDYFEENGTAYFVMHYVEGLTLKAFIKKKGGRLPFDLTLKIMVPVLKALSAVHRQALLHRDVSPDNIYITRKGQIKLLDFGAARQVTGARGVGLSVILKPGFAPEEQYRGRSKQGPFTDVYAAACTMYYALTGQIPTEALDRLDDDPLKKPSELAVMLPEAAEKALLKAMSVRSQDRFQSVDDFLRTITSGKVEPPVIPPEKQVAEAATPLQMEAAPSGPNPLAFSEKRHEPSTRREPGKHRNLWIFGLILLVTAMAGAVLFSWRRSIQATRPLARQEIRRFPLSDLEGVVDRSKVSLDLKASGNGTGSFKIESDNSGWVRLYHIQELPIESAALIYQAKLKTRGLQGRAFLVMTARKSDGEILRARGADSPLSGDTDWTMVEIALFPKAVLFLSNLELDVAVWGHGEVWIKDIRLLKAPYPSGQPDSMAAPPPHQPPPDQGRAGPGRPREGRPGPEGRPRY